MKNVLVTGSSGFIGMHLCQHLLSRGDNVLGIDNMNDYYSEDLKNARLKILQEYDKFNFLKIDLCDADSLESVFNNYNPLVVVNLAAQAGVRYSLSNPSSYINSNIVGFMNLLECSRKHNIKSLVYASSSSVYGSNNKIPFSIYDKADNPISIYAASKKSNELMAYSYHYLFGINITGLRFFTVYGPWGRPDMAYYKFCDKIIKGESIAVYNNGNIKRDFTYIDDIIKGTVSAIDNNYSCEIFNLGNSCCEDVMNMIHLLEDHLGKKAVIEYKDMQPGDVKTTYAEIEYSREKLDYDPTTTLNEGIPQFIDWFKSYYDLGN